MRKYVVRLCLLMLYLSARCSSTIAFAQATFPTGPVKFISPLATGVGTDSAMRIVAERLGAMWGRSTIFINQPGAGGAIATRAALAAAPDGQTLFLGAASTFTVLPTVDPSLAKSIGEFVPIGFAGEVPMAIAVSPTLPVNSLSELISLSKKRPQGLNAAVEFRGGVPHLTIELLRVRSDANINPIYYVKGTSAMSDVIAGRVPVMVQGLSSPIAAGQLKLLAVASPARLSAYPKLPTVSETVPGFAVSGWFVLVAPPGTPNSIAVKVNHDLRAALADPQVSSKLAAANISTRSLSPQQLTEFLYSEQQLWRPILTQLNLATH
jgi:tripartite-type tricarboxylate transporter receptor subunit TctC